VCNTKLLESFDPREWQLKDLAIAEPGISTRGADVAATALKRGRCARDFFVFKTTVAAAHRTMQRSEFEVSQFGAPHLDTHSPDHPLSSQQGAINAHLEEELSLEQLAHECKLSVTHFAKAFARSTGISPHRWLMQRRVDVAKDLLLTTDSSLVEISLKCGFSDQSDFTRVFAEATGETPGRWRQIQLN
jgi:transcriptional regulator GlxA family with amidase domain